MQSTFPLNLLFRLLMKNASKTNGIQTNNRITVLNKISLCDTKSSIKNLTSRKYRL